MPLQVGLSLLPEVPPSRGSAAIPLGSCPSLSSSPCHPTLIDVTARLFMGLHWEVDKGTISVKNSSAKKIVELRSEMPHVFQSRQEGLGTVGRQEPRKGRQKGSLAFASCERCQPSPRDTQNGRLAYAEFAFSLTGFSFSTSGVFHTEETLLTVQHPALQSKPLWKITVWLWQKSSEGITEFSRAVGEPHPCHSQCHVELCVSTDRAAAASAAFAITARTGCSERSSSSSCELPSSHMHVREREILPAAAVGRWRQAKLPVPVGMPPVNHSELLVPSLRDLCSPINPSTDTCHVSGG